MPPDEIEQVDPGALAALERVAQARDSPPLPLPAHTYLGGTSGLCRVPGCGLALAADIHLLDEPTPHVEVASLLDASDGSGHAPRRTMTREEAEQRYPAPAAALSAFVEASAVDARLAALDARLQRIEAQTRHMMLLVMVLADRNRVAPEEYQRAEALARQAETGGA